MNRPFNIILTLCLWCSTSSIAGIHQRQIASGGRSTISTRSLDANRLWFAVTDRGYLNYDSSGWSTFPRGSQWWDSAGFTHFIVFDQGPWIIGKLNGTPAAAMTLWHSSFSPGPVVGGRPALDVQPQDSVRYHPYKITRNGNPHDPDAADWPADLGAPTDPQGKPLVSGDQMVWTVFNGADTNLFAEGWSVDIALRARRQFPRLPVEIHQSIYAWKSTGNADTSLLANTVFLEWIFINKGVSPIESCYVGHWADIDIDLGQENLTAIDTSLQLGYCWVRSSDYHEPFAIGFSMLHGPIVPSLGESAIFRGRSRAGYRNLPLWSFMGISQNWGRDSLFGSAPNKINAAWNVARGFDKLGNVILDSVTQLPTRFPFSGDPVTGSGWVDNRHNPGQAGTLMFSGPFTLAVGDTQWMMVALVPADAGDPIASITLLRNKTARIRALSYEELAHPTPLGVQQTEIPLPANVELQQNFPNPFNPITTIKYVLPKSSMVRLSVFDVLGREVNLLVNERKDGGAYEVKFDGSGLASGVYFYRLNAGSFVKTLKLLLLR